MKMEQQKYHLVLIDSDFQIMKCHQYIHNMRYLEKNKRIKVQI